MNWKPVEEPPKEDIGSFAVAILPIDPDMTLKELNQWRKKHGFTKALYAFGEWELVHARKYIDRIATHRVTHWDYLPEVPELTEIPKQYGHA